MNPKSLALLAAMVFVAPVPLSAGKQKPHLATKPTVLKPGQRIVDGLKLSSRLVTGPNGSEVVLTSNAARGPISTQVRVAVMLTPASSPMSRVVRMPREAGWALVAVNLKAGERLNQRVRFPKIKVASVKKKAKPARARNRVALRMTPARYSIRVSKAKPGKNTAPTQKTLVARLGS